MANEDSNKVDLQIESLLAQLSYYTENSDDNINPEDIDSAKALKAVIEPLKGLRMYVDHCTSPNSILDHVREKIDFVEQWLNQKKRDRKIRARNEELLQIVQKGININELKFRHFQQPDTGRQKSMSAKIKDICESAKTIRRVEQWLKEKRSQIEKEKGEKKRRIVDQEGTSSQQSSTMSKSFSVLIVDDDSHFQKLQSTAFYSLGKANNFGMEVDVATNGEESVRLLRNGASFDLIIMDMDRSTNGVLELESSIIGVTSSTSEPEKQAFMKAGIDGCFQKPLTVDVIASLLNLSNNN